MTCEECEKYKKLAELNMEDLKKMVEKDKEFKKSLESVITTIANAPVEKPEMYYTFKDEPMDYKELAKWFDHLENYYHIAQRYEEQERGSCCCVDRAYGRYLMPECQKLLEHLEKNGFKGLL